jgi:hypothetical protein
VAVQIRTVMQAGHGLDFAGEDAEGMGGGEGEGGRGVGKEAKPVEVAGWRTMRLALKQPDSDNIAPCDAASSREHGRRPLVLTSKTRHTQPFFHGLLVRTLGRPSPLAHWTVLKIQHAGTGFSLRCGPGPPSHALALCTTVPVFVLCRRSAGITVQPVLYAPRRAETGHEKPVKAGSSRLCLCSMPLGTPQNRVASAGEWTWRAASSVEDCTCLCVMRAPLHILFNMKV